MFLVYCIRFKPHSTMKKFFFALFLTSSLLTYGQSNEDISNIYIKRAQKSFDNLEIDKSLSNFNKAMKYVDSIASPSIAKLGAFIHYELSNYTETKEYATQYFALVKKRNEEEYTEMLDIYVTVTEEIEKEEAEQKRLEALRIKEEKHGKKIDSLKVVWENKAALLSLKVDTIYNFQKNNSAVYKENNTIGIINDKGIPLIKATTYTAFKRFDGYILLLDKAIHPSKIYCYNTETKQGFLLPDISNFNTLSTHYNAITLPRGNDKLILYPNNALRVIEFDLKRQKMIVIANEKELLKNLKRADKIAKYNKEGQVKINKQWLSFGGHIGGGIYVLFNADYSVYGYLCSIDGTLLKSETHPYLGVYHNNTVEVIKEDKTFWMNQNGTQIEMSKDLSGDYTGTSRIVKLSNGNYQILENDVIVLGDERLENKTLFIEKNIN